MEWRRLSLTPIPLGSAGHVVERRKRKVVVVVLVALFASLEMFVYLYLMQQEPILGAFGWICSWVVSLYIHNQQSILQVGEGGFQY
jgi:hypothetical protein